MGDTFCGRCSAMQRRLMKSIPSFTTIVWGNKLENKQGESSWSSLECNITKYRHRAGMRQSRFSVAARFSKWLHCRKISVGRSQKQQSLPFQHLNYAKQVNKTGTGAFIYQSGKHGYVLNKKTALLGGERGRGEKTDEEWRTVWAPDNHTFYTELCRVQILAVCAKLYWNVSRAFHHLQFAIKTESCILKGTGRDWNRRRRACTGMKIILQHPGWASGCDTGWLIQTGNRTEMPPETKCRVCYISKELTFFLQ